jgi:hypothetical protein
MWLLSVSCGTCGAVRGVACYTRGGRLSPTTHMARLRTLRGDGRVVDKRQLALFSAAA